MRRDLPEVESLLGKKAESPYPPAVVIEALSPLVSDERHARIESVLNGRTRDVIPVLEGLTDPHNTAAVLRSADAFGIQEVHVIDEASRFVASIRVTKGTERWLDIVRSNDTLSAVRALQSRGYKVLYASMEGSMTPEDLASIDKVAIVFGNEHAGVSESMRQAADGSYRIAMRGFVESLNVSVAAGITLHEAMRNRTPHLDAEDRLALRARFLMVSVDRAEMVVDEFARRAAKEE
ncbi:MAG: RNA methyltransferase [Sandaracinaceae bacterium]|nr:RNA methyltransferase [Sandaracinaceae bacterium]